MKLEKINKTAKTVILYLLLFFSFDVVYSNFFFQVRFKI